MKKKITLELLIIWLMFAILPVDMLNGFLLHSNIHLPFFSLGQLFKLILLSLLIFSFIKNKNNFYYISILATLLFLPSLFRVIAEFKINFLVQDFIKIFRYLMPIVVFFFFKRIIISEKKENLKLIFNLVVFSYIIFVFNILLKYLGLGYAMYPNGDIGSKGFFFAGNETSALLIILSSIIGFKIFNKKEKLKYFLFFIFNLFVGLTISSKTGTLGVFLVFVLIPIKPFKPRIKAKYLRNIIISTFLILPLISFFTWKYIIITPAFKRLEFFWNKLEFLTFVFSNRNNFFIKAWDVFCSDYNFFEKIIGVGQTKYEQLNGNSIVEIDIADIFFAYGITGLILFIFLMTLIYTKAKKLRNKRNPYASLVFLMIFILLAISTLAGHVYSSGMSAVFIGLLFSLIFMKKPI